MQTAPEGAYSGNSPLIESDRGSDTFQVSFFQALSTPSPVLKFLLILDRSQVLHLSLLCPSK